MDLQSARDNHPARISVSAHQRGLAPMGDGCRIEWIMPPEDPRSAPDPRSVFIVHGRNLVARDALQSFLTSAGLKPIPWEAAAAKAGEKNKTANPFIGQILDAGFDMAQAVVVLLTGDDVARVQRSFEREKLTPQARPNVLLEAGMALGRFPERTILVQIGEIRGVSDISGRYILRLDRPDGEALSELLNRLSAAHCTVDQPSVPVEPLPAGFRALKPDPGIDVSRSRFWALCTALVIGGLLIGYLLPRPEVTFRGRVNIRREPMTAYLAVDQRRKVASGDIELRLRRDPSYVVLYEVQKKLVSDVPLKPGEPLPVLNVDDAFLSSGGDCSPQPRVQPQILVKDDQVGGGQR
jgi:hypothetical protein